MEQQWALSIEFPAGRFYIVEDENGAPWVDRKPGKTWAERRTAVKALGRLRAWGDKYAPTYFTENHYPGFLSHVEVTEVKAKRVRAKKVKTVKEEAHTAAIEIEKAVPFESFEESCSRPEPEPVVQYGG